MVSRKDNGRDFAPTAVPRAVSPVVDTRVIYCGDNLTQLRRIPDKCVDLVYIDPPFNSDRLYETFWGETQERRAFEDRHESTQSYVEFMRARCFELHRILKQTGSFYCHCDWHASHYLKVMLDGVFGDGSFRNEIIWKRSSAHIDTKQGMSQFGHIYDSILFYTVSDNWTWNPQYQSYDPEYIEAFYRHLEDETGRRYRLSDLTAAKPGGDTQYEWRGVKPYKGRYWAYSKDKMEQFEREGRLYYSKSGMPSYKRYLDEMPGVPLQDLWTDIRPIGSGAAERLGYPTQKPLALLERIINASSNPGDIVLDAFCGCGTALVAAEKLSRQWIGIDVSPTACRVMANRLRKVARLREDEELWRVGRGFVVRDLPWTEEELRRLPPFEFENWAIIALGGIPNKTQVGDRGVDGRVYPVASTPKQNAAQLNQLDFMDDWYPVQVKQKDRVGRPEIDSFEAALMREDKKKGFIVAFGYSAEAQAEISRFFQQSGRVIVALTVREILDEQIAHKLA